MEDDDSDKTTAEVLRDTPPFLLILRPFQTLASQFIGYCQAILEILFRPLRFFRLALVSRQPADRLFGDKIQWLITRKQPRIIRPWMFLAASVFISYISFDLVGPAWMDQANEIMYGQWKAAIISEVERDPYLFATQHFRTDMELHRQVMDEPDPQKKLDIILDRVNKSLLGTSPQQRRFDFSSDFSFESYIYGLRSDLRVAIFMTIFLFYFQAHSGIRVFRKGRWGMFWYWVYMLGIAILLSSLFRPILSYVVPPKNIVGVIAVLFGPFMFIEPVVIVLTCVIAPIFMIPVIFRVPWKRVACGVFAGTIQVTMIGAFIVVVDLFRSGYWAARSVGLLK